MTKTKIYRKKQPWLYEKYLMEHQNDAASIVEGQSKRSTDFLGNKYKLLDAFWYLIPLMLIVAGMCLIFQERI